MAHPSIPIVYRMVSIGDILDVCGLTASDILQETTGDEHTRMYLLLELVKRIAETSYEAGINDGSKLIIKSSKDPWDDALSDLGPNPP